MCIAIVNNDSRPIKKKTFFASWESNPDGASFMYAVGGKIHVIKELEKPEILWTKYIAAKKRYEVPMVLHFRIGTSGTKDLYNVHPFKVKDDVYFCHNGILNITVPKESKENDTQIFNNVILKNLPSNFLNDAAILNLIELSIGTGNKFIFLDVTGAATIINERAGHWIGENWFSNYSYCDTYYNNYRPVITTFNSDKDYPSKYKNKVPTEICEACDEITFELKYLAGFNLDVCARCYTEYKYDTDTENYFKKQKSNELW